jgi:hypothetical protein
MERLLAIAIFMFWIPLEASANLAQRLGSTYGTCAREGELEMVRVAFGSNLTAKQVEDLESAVYEFRNRRPQGVDCQCPTIGPAVLTDLETQIEGALGILLENPTGFTAAESQRINAVISACETREQRVFTQSLAVSRGVYNDVVPDGFSRVRRFTHPNGLEGYILKKINTNPEELMVAFSGTEGGADAISSITARGRNQHNAAEAMLMGEMVQHMEQGKKVTCTGHSLGGALAQGFCASLLARMQARDPGFSTRQADNRLRVVTFGSLGGSPLVTNEDNIRTTWFASNNTHFVVKGDIVPRFEPPTCGQIRMIGGNTEREPLVAHDLGTFEAIASNGWSSVKQGFRRIDQAAVDILNHVQQGLSKMWKGLHSSSN